MTNQKRVSQETFDETVKENMDDFDMSREDAIADAIDQFKMQVSCDGPTPTPMPLLLRGGRADVRTEQCM